MKLLGTTNQRAYLRKMAMDGYIINLDMDRIRETVKLLRNISGNMNQIARRVNETGNFYEQEVEDLRRGYAMIQKNMLVLISKFAKL